MRFSAIFTALVATITPVLAATVPLEARSDAPCRADQEDDQRCGTRSNRIEVCKAKNGGHYWGQFVWCANNEYCDEFVPGTAVCKLYGYIGPICTFGCKFVDGNYIPMNETDVKTAKVEGAKVNDTAAETPKVDAGETKPVDNSKRDRDASCEPWQEYDLQCSPNARNIEMCEYNAAHGRYRWDILSHCNFNAYCDGSIPGAPRCRLFGYQPQPVCLFGCKLVNGTHVPMNATEIETMKPEAAKAGAGN